MLKLPQVVLFVFFLSFTPVTSLQAEEGVTDWKTVGSWSISFFSGLPGCAASMIYEDGTFFLIGLKKRDDATLLEIAMMDDAWESLEEGKDYSIKAYFGDETPWTLDMRGRHFSDTPGLTFSMDAYSENAGILVDEFQRELDMKWYYKNVMLGHYSLRDTRRAFDEVVACQKSFNEAVSGVSDPFSRAPNGRSTDPFSQ